MSEEENCSVHGMNLFGFYVPEDEEGGASTAAVIATTTASPQSAQVEEKRNYKT